MLLHSAYKCVVPVSWAIMLVPRPFPPPVFDHVQYANMVGEGLGDLVTCDDVG